MTVSKRAQIVWRLVFVLSVSIILISWLIAQQGDYRLTWGLVAGCLYVLAVPLAYVIVSRVHGEPRRVRGWAIAVLFGVSTVLAATVPRGWWDLVFGAVFLGAFTGGSVASNERHYGTSLLG
jgi:hypothetical protein